MLIADLHIHSRFSMATSKDSDLAHLDQWARYKGIGIVGTGDFSHPVWREEMHRMLEKDESGLYILKEAYRLPACVAELTRQVPHFAVSGEISTVYKRDGKTRRVHHLIILPDLESADALAAHLAAIGNIQSDGRPILNLDSHDLLQMVLDVSADAILIPAHVWTPYYSVFGAFSQFESLEECYGDLAGEIRAIETGLSSDPPMNRRVSMLDGLNLISNSDAHSPSKLGREANLLSCECSYSALRRAICTGDGLEGTIEFFSEEGKYHLDGHRACGICLKPEETAKHDGKCPVCGRPLTTGVLNRIERMADRKCGDISHLDKPFEPIIPLKELLADCIGASSTGKKVEKMYFDLLKTLGSEFYILRSAPIQDISMAAGPAVGEGIRRMRQGRVVKTPGYDGRYGTITLLTESERKSFM